MIRIAATAGIFLVVTLSCAEFDRMIDTADRTDLISRRTAGALAIGNQAGMVVVDEWEEPSPGTVEAGTRPTGNGGAAGTEPTSTTRPDARPKPKIDPETIASAKREFLAGRDAIEAKEFDVAIEHFNASIELYPRAASHFNIGLCQEALDQPDAALESYEAAIMLDPEHAGAAKALEALKKR